MYTITAKNGAGALAIGPYNVQDALRRSIDLRDQGYESITLKSVETGVEVDVEQFMRNPPEA